MESADTFIAPPHKLWTREECAILERTGVLDPERYELKMSKNDPHMLALLILTGWLYGVFGMFFVMPKPSIDLQPRK